jgi:predicted TPR repeat methyltransferase
VDRVSRLICFDVSKRFMKVARARLDAHGAPAEVRFEHLKQRDHREIQRAVGKLGAAETVDLFYSVDSMQHVELHTLTGYWIAAAEVLKPGGHLVMTVGNAASDQGFERLLSDVKRCYGRFQSAHQFYYLSRDLVTSCLDRLGFDVESLTEGRDINFVARKARAPRARFPAP